MDRGRPLPWYTFAPSVVALGLITALIGVLGPIANTVGQSYQAALIPDELRGRVFGARRVLVFGAIPLGSAGAGFLLQSLGPHLTVWIVVAGLTVLALAATLSTAISDASRIGYVLRAVALLQGAWILRRLRAHPI